MIYNTLDGTKHRVNIAEGNIRKLDAVVETSK